MEANCSFAPRSDRVFRGVCPRAGARRAKGRFSAAFVDQPFLGRFLTPLSPFFQPSVMDFQSVSVKVYVVILSLDFSCFLFDFI